MSNEYPKALYCKGGSEEIWGLKCTTRIVADAAAEEAARAEDYHGSPGAAHGIAEEPAPQPVSRSEAEEMREMIAMLEQENAELRSQIAAFDGDGDGRPGGSKSRKPATA